MSNAAKKLQEGNAEVTLSAGQLEGLGKIGDAANQITELLKLALTALESMRDSIDIDAIADRVGPEVEALIQTLGELINFLGIDSAETLQRSVHENLQALEAAQLHETAPEMIQLLGALHSSGLLKILPPLLEQVGTLTAELDAEALDDRLKALNTNLHYWTLTAREGARIITDQIGELDLPEKAAILEDIADQWWHIALRAKRLAQGDAENLGDRVEWLLSQAEHWNGQLAVAYGTVRDLAPELLSEVDFSAIGAKVAAGALEWVDIARQAGDLVKGDAESLTVRIQTMLEGARAAGLDQMIPELITLLGALHNSGLLKVLPPLLEQVGPLTADLDAEALSERLKSLNENLRYWATTAREGARVVADQIGELDLPEKVAVLEDMADQWWHIALRAKSLAQGDAENLGERLEWLLGQAEHWSGQLAVAVGTVRDLAPELLNEVDLGAIGAKVAAGALEWIDIARQATDLVKGDAESLAARIQVMLEGAREAGLDQMIPELMTLLGTVNRAGLLRKVNTLLAAVEPHIPADDQLKNWIEQGTVLAQRYQPQIAGALPALDATFKVMEGTEKKGGGLFGLLGIVFSRKTQYLLRFVIEFAYRFLRGNKA